MGRGIPGMWCTVEAMTSWGDAPALCCSAPPTRIATQTAVRRHDSVPLSVPWLSAIEWASPLTRLRPAFTQNPHKLLVIPGPIEVSDAVLHANASASVSHVSPEFVQIFKQTLSMVLDVVYAPPTAQPFVIAGSGTLGWDMAAANLIEPGEEALVLNNGYFADSFKDCLETYGVKVDTVQAELGHTVTPEQLASHLEKAKGKTYKLVTITHCDTSTGVLADAKALAAVVNKHSPQSLVVLDGVCSVASDEIRFKDWGLDLVLTASQKGLGCPPGLCIFVASERAVKVLEDRKSRPGSYYASWKKWLPSEFLVSSDDQLSGQEIFLTEDTCSSNYYSYESLSSRKSCIFRYAVSFVLVLTYEISEARDRVLIQKTHHHSQWRVPEAQTN